jgi:hypothetical protein
VEYDAHNIKHINLYIYDISYYIILYVHIIINIAGTKYSFFVIVNTKEVIYIIAYNFIQIKLLLYLYPYTYKFIVVFAFTKV